MRKFGLILSFLILSNLFCYGQNIDKTECIYNESGNSQKVKKLMARNGYELKIFGTSDKNQNDSLPEVTTYAVQKKGDIEFNKKEIHLSVLKYKDPCGAKIGFEKTYREYCYTEEERKTFVGKEDDGPIFAILLNDKWIKLYSHENWDDVLIEKVFNQLISSLLKGNAQKGSVWRKYKYKNAVVE